MISRLTAMIKRRMLVASGCNCRSQRCANSSNYLM